MTYSVRPAVYHRGYCPTVGLSKKQALEQKAWLEEKTGFKWTIYSDEEEDDDEDNGNPEFVLKSEACTQAYDTYAKAREGFVIHHDYYVREGWDVVCEHQSKREIVIDGVPVRALRNVYRKNGKTEDLCLSVRIEID